MTQIKLQRIHVEQFHTRIGEFFPQPSHHEPILFNEGERDVVGEEMFGQRPETRADFDNVVAWLDPELRNDPARHVLIMEKILSEALARTSLKAREGVLDFGECHELLRADRSAIHKVPVNNPPGETGFLPKLFTGPRVAGLPGGRRHGMGMAETGHLAWRRTNIKPSQGSGASPREETWAQSWGVRSGGNGVLSAALPPGIGKETAFSG